MTSIPQSNPTPQGESQLYIEYLKHHKLPLCYCGVNDGYRATCPHYYWGCPHQTEVILDDLIPRDTAPKEVEHE